MNSRDNVLARLRNAEQQFRQASILTILDAEKLELFTFYKKVDVVKDQKTMLIKFGHVCKLNHCKIAYKNACRIVELLKPEQARVHRLFTAAVISSLHLIVPNSGKVLKINSQIFLLQAPEKHQAEWSPTDEEHTHWFLERVELQISVPSGQLLLAVRHANWPPLIAMSDLIDPEIWPINHSLGSTLYLVPTGQLAKYYGKWITATTIEQQISMAAFGEDVDRRRQQARWIEKAKDWFGAHSQTAPLMESGTIWLEVEIPVFEKPTTNVAQERRLVWKTVYWPATLSYIFAPENEPDNECSISMQDPLIAAREWLLSGAAAAQHPKIVASTDDQAWKREDDPLSDDDVHFGSPQQYVSLPMQTFTQSQTVYPTPPEAFNTQPTPGMSVDGAVQTPATFSGTYMAIQNSSPLATLTDAGAVHLHEGPGQAISNFLQHNADDDLFDDMEEEPLEHASFADEPNWDFFNAENAVMGAHSGTIVSARTAAADNAARSRESEALALEDDIMALMSPRGRSVRREMLPIDFVEEEAPFSGSLSDKIVTERKASSDMVLHERETPREQRESSVSCSRTTNISKRRRSSVYDVSTAQPVERDLKYTARGKYWFQPKKQSTTTRTMFSIPTPANGRASSGSESSSAMSQSPSEPADVQAQELHPWTIYAPSITDKILNPTTPISHDASNYDAEVDMLLALIAAASGMEPFTLPYLPQRKKPGPMLSDFEHTSMAVQVMIEQLVQSSLLKGHCCLSIPPSKHSLTFEVSVDNAGMNTILPNASLSELALPDQSNSQAKTGCRIIPLDHGKLRLRQADCDIAVELSATKFWEILNLQPLGGDKDVLAICLHPDSDNHKQGATTFLQRMAETWSSCNLGNHQNVQLNDVTDTGEVSWSTLAGLKELCHRLGEWLAADGIDACIVVYMVVPEDDLSQCFALCEAFVELFETLEELREIDTGDLVLQLVPTSFIVRTDTIAIEPEDAFMSLALEVYLRLPLSNITGLEAAASTPVSAPASILHEPVSRNLYFELSTNNAAPMTRYGECCHVAYCFSLDNKWLVASWSDSVGNIAMTIPYRLDAADGTVLHSRQEIYHHMCQTSAEMMNRRRKKWWLAIVKIGLHELEERQAWSVCVNSLSQDHRLLSHVILLNAELQPRLALNGSPLPARQVQNQHVPNTLTTPVSTPQATNTTSPEQTIAVTPTAGATYALNAPTPPENTGDPGTDSDIVLNDPLEDSWTVTLAFGLNQSHNLLEKRPAKASGLLLKRTVPQGKMGSNIAMLGINLISGLRRTASTSPPSLEEQQQDRDDCNQILEEILVQYRGLHLIGVARQCIDPRGNCVPLHIASAYKGARVLEKFV